jgi:4-hydroxybenzoate polyprenyltransferase
MAILAGAGLAIANARADLETDAAAGTISVATMLGRQRSWLVEAGLMAAAIAVGVVSLAARGFSAGPWALVGAGVAIVARGIVLGRSNDPRARARGWEAQAIGAAIAATGWVAAMTLPG